MYALKHIALHAKAIVSYKNAIKIFIDIISNFGILFINLFSLKLKCRAFT